MKENNKQKADRLSLSVKQFENYIRSLPEEKLKFSTTPKWKAREVLIHLVFWHEQYVNILKSLINGEKPTLFKEPFIMLNAMAVEMNRDVSIKDLLKRLANAQIKLVKLVNESAEKKMEIKIAFREGSKVRELSEALFAIDRHFNSHLRQLNRS